MPGDLRDCGRRGQGASGGINFAAGRGEGLYFSRICGTIALTAGCEGGYG